MKQPAGSDGEVVGLAHVASCSFLASRVAPNGLMFWTALGGGMALARVASDRRLRAGYAASIAAIVQTVALIGPARVNGPLTQALNAPVMGHLYGAGASKAVQLLAGLMIRYAHYLVVNVLYVAVLIGGLEEFVATYNGLADLLRFLPRGMGWAIGFSVVLSVIYGLVWTSIQLYAYNRALPSWPAPATPTSLPRGAAVRIGPWPVVVIVLMLATWVALLISHSWLMLAITGAAIAIAVLVTGTWRRRSAWMVAAGLTLALAIAALVPALLGAVEWETAGQRAVRALLLVASATWAREAIGTDKAREIARRALVRLRFIPGFADAAELVSRLQSDTRLGPAGSDLLARLGAVELEPAPVADALKDWIVEESRVYIPPGGDPAPAQP